MNQRPTEAECQTAIIEAAKTVGWLVHHSRPGRTNTGWATAIEGHAGLPDLVLAHRTRGVMFVELKRRGNSVTGAQQAWLDTLRAAGVDARLVIVPEEMDAFLSELTAPTGRAA